MGVMSLSEIMDKSIEVLKKYIKAILLFVLSFGAIEVGIFLVLFLFGGMIAFVSFIVTKSFAVLFIILAVVCILYLIVAMSQSIGMIKIASQEFLQERVTIGVALGATFKNMHKVLGVILIEFIMFIPILAICAGLVFLIGNVTSFSFFSENLSGNYILAIILYVIVILVEIFSAFFYKTLFSFSFHAITVEKKGIISSIKKSFFLVKHNLWKVFGYQLLFYLVILGIDSSIKSLFALFFSALYLLLHFINTNLNYFTFIYTSVNALSWPLNLLTMMVIAPLENIMITLLYFNLRFKKEGYDLELKLKWIQKNQKKGLVRNAIYSNNSF